MAEKGKLEELLQSTEVKKAKHSLLRVQTSGADSSLFSLDARSDTAIATNFDLLDNLPLAETNFDILNDMILTETNFDILDDLTLTETNFDILDSWSLTEANFDSFEYLEVTETNLDVLPDFDIDFDIFSCHSHTDVFAESYAPSFNVQVNNAYNGELILDEIENITTSCRFINKWLLKVVPVVVAIQSDYIMQFLNFIYRVFIKIKGEGYDV